MVKLKWIALGLLGLLALCLGGCAKQRADITVMDNFIQDDTLGECFNAPALRFDALLEAWKDGHPDIELDEKKRAGSGDISALAVLGADHLPDVFMASPTLGRLLVEKGLVLDLSDYIPVQERVEPFVYGGAAYAFPATAPSFSVVIHEGDFPDSWTALYARRYKVAWGGNITDLLSPAMAANGAQAWFDHMIAADKECTFLNDDIMEAIVDATEMRDSGLLVEMTADEAILAFINRKYCAVVLNEESVYRLIDQLDSERRKLLRFSVFPSIAGEKNTPIGVPYGFFINARLAEDAGKLALCVELCRHLMQAAGADRGDDEALERLDNFIRQAKPCRNCAYYLSSEVWSPLKNTQLPPIETAVKMQNCYDQYYLGVEDFSKQMDLYYEEK